MIATWQRSHEAFAEGAHEAPWLHQLRGAALARFEQLGLPGSHLEAWKRTPVKAIADVAFTHGEPEREAGAVEALVAPHRLAHAAAELVLVDGRVVPSLSRGIDRSSAWEVSSLADALRARPDELRDHLGRLAAWQDEAFTALNVAFLQDGLYLRVHAGHEVAAPVHVISVTRGDGTPVVANVRHLVVAEPGSRVSVIETLVGAEGEVSLTNAVTEVFVGANAEVHHTVAGLHPEQAHLIHTVEARLERDARWRSHVTWLGGALTRSNVRVVHAGENAEARVDGLYVLGGRQHTDNHVVVDHVAARCTTRESYKGVLGGRSKGVFDGTVIVRQDAQHTDSTQEAHNLLVSYDADAHARPVLEIYADDVKCGHGTTIGQLDRRQLAYLTSRGIPRDEARRMLTGAFVADRVEQVADEILRARLRDLVAQKVARIQDLPDLPTTDHPTTTTGAA